MVSPGPGGASRSGRRRARNSAGGGRGPRPVARARHGAGRLAARPVLVGLVAAQGIGLLAVAGFFAAEIARERVALPRGAAFVLVLAALGGTGLLRVAWGLRALRRWSRAPALLTQLLLFSLAVPALPGPRWYVGAALLAWALAVLALLLPGGTEQTDRSVE